MKKKFLIPVFLCFFLVFLPGCSKKAAQAKPLCRVVTAAEIIGQEKGVQIHRKYTDTQKIQWVLLYLRTIEPDIRPTVPPENPASRYEICLTFSSGERKIFRQAAHRFFCAQPRSWHAIDPAQAAGLYALLRQVPGDPV